MFFWLASRAVLARFLRLCPKWREFLRYSVLYVATPLLLPAYGYAFPEIDNLYNKAAPTNLATPSGSQWQLLEPGLELGEFALYGEADSLTVLRIDPDRFEFVLCASGKEGSPMRSLSQWATEKNLAAAINASMYLPDNRTSTGYMRQGDYINNKKIMQRFGAFFVAGPRKGGLPQAAIIDRDMPGWRELLDSYELVIQNYRMINSDRRILWEPGGPDYAISAVAQDGAGNILFLHSRKPIEAYSFAQELLKLPLDVRTVMYVEGGAQAGLLVNSGGQKRDLGQTHAPSFLITGNLKAVLPNVLGIHSHDRQMVIQE